VLVITDAHVSEANGNVAAFFDMLDAVAAGGEDVVFLGDIFDLWIALPRYEDAHQARFLNWCRREKARRVIGFVEGNHEFYVVHRHCDAFTWADADGRRDGRLLWVHGDLINRADTNYLRWRRLSKNALMRALVRVLPGGPRLVQRVKAKMKKTNKAFRIGLPREALKAFAARCAGTVDQVFVGHFHEAYAVEADGVRLAVLPDWFADQSVTLIDTRAGTHVSGHWRTLSAPEGR